MTGFHRWLSTDAEAEDQCIGCGVVTPNFGEGVISDYSPLPIMCPGPDVARPHHFIDSPRQGTIECAVCTYFIGSDTLPIGVMWECPDPEPIPKVGNDESMTVHFDLAIVVYDDGSATAILSDPGSFDVPIVEVGGSTPDLALAALAEKVTIPLPGVWTNGTRVNPGVIPGGSAPNGHYVGKAVIEMALDLGWHDEMARGAVETYDDWYYRPEWAHADHWHDLVDEAEGWLNQHTTGGMWHSTDGDFRLSATETCPHCGDDRFANPDAEDFACDTHLAWD